jgi:sugar phosphate permease
VAGCVNYMDRSTLAVANHDIAADLHFSPAQMGALLSAFAWAYALLQLPVGVLTDRVGPHIMLSLGMTVWSLAQLVSGTVQGFGQFLMARMGLGVGESPMFTAGARASVNWFPVKNRGLPLGLFNAASSLGPALAPPLLTALMLAFGWRPMFMIMSFAGFAVAALWAIHYRDPEHAGVPSDDIAAIHAGESGNEVEANSMTWARLFAVPTTWALMGGLFGIVYVTWLYVAWLPEYLESVRSVGVAETGTLAAIPQFAGFIGGSLGGLVSDHLARADIDPVTSRKVPTVLGLTIAGLCTAFVPLIGNLTATLALMSAAMFFAYAAGSCSWALGATMTPPKMVATLESVQNIGGSIGGALAPLVTGFVVQYTHAFNWAFEIAAVVAIVSALSYALVNKDAYGKPGSLS